MRYRSLGRSGVQVSQLCLGLMTFGLKTEQDEANRMIDHFLDAGGNFLDTANVYSRGLSEEMTGKTLSGGKRNRVVLATKVHVRMGEGPNDWGNSRFHIMKQCEDSLRRLQTDHIDLYQVHRPQPSVPIDETLRALDDLVHSGKVLYIGTSTFAAWQIVESLWASRDLGLNRFVSEQAPYNILDRRIERELVPMALTYGIGLIPWSPLDGGRLTGKYHRGAAVPAGSRFAGRQITEDPHATSDRTWTVLEGLEVLAREKGCTMTALALAWMNSQPGITAPIIGPRDVNQLQENLASADVSIGDEDRKRIDALVPPGTNTEDHYKAHFGPHPHRV
jgi:aryl-alcohol dehydrogenase-like predicted oxidoreductase